MMKINYITILFFCFSTTFLTSAQQQESGEDVTFEQAAGSIRQQLEDSVEELNSLREQIAATKIPLSKKLNELETELIDVGRQYQQTSRLLDSRTLDLSNLRSEIKTRKEESSYLSNLLSEYARNFESRLHIAEIKRYDDELEAAKLAPEDSNLSQKQIYRAQTALIEVSFARLSDAIGGTSFEGTAVDKGGVVKQGEFVLLGPAAIFSSNDKTHIGTIEQKLGSLEPAITAFNNPEDAQAAGSLIEEKSGLFPLDPTLGNAHVIEATKETLLQHIQKGGPVMVPILAMAAAALIVALYKWAVLTLVSKPGKKRIRKLLNAVAMQDEETAAKVASNIKGPFGKMLSDAVEYLKEPAELIEEVMYETVLSTKLRLQSMLPFIAISAASAPLLGLLGTVTGIINTFKLITIFGSGDVKTLSGGISEALITTEFGLIVAIPSLLLHAFLSRKAKSITDDMEKTAVSLINQVNLASHNSKTQVSEGDRDELNTV
jgi:biopolymer transport protein ExbB